MKMKKLTYIRLVLEWVKKDERDFQHISKTDKINIENKECLDIVNVYFNFDNKFCVSVFLVS